MANAAGYYLSGSNHDSDSGFAYNLGNHFVLFSTHYIYHQKYQTSPSTAHFRGQYGVMRQLGTGRLFLLSSVQAALTEPDFYECVKCLVDTLNLIYDHNNNGATSLREREATTREKRIWSIKHGQESFPTGGGHRQWGDAGQRIYHTAGSSKPHRRSLACLSMFNAEGQKVIREQTQKRQGGLGKCGSQHLEPQG